MILSGKEINEPIDIEIEPFNSGNLNLFKNYCLEGDDLKVELSHIAYLEYLLDMPNLEDVYVFVAKDGSVDYWFVVSDIDYEDELKYIRKSLDFCNDNKINNYEFLIIRKPQLLIDKIPTPTYSLHKNKER